MPTLALTAGAMHSLNAPAPFVLGTRVSQARVNLIQSDSRTLKSRRHTPDQNHNVLAPVKAFGLVKGHALALSSQPLPLYLFKGVFDRGNS
jgi:hypothetical protein